VPALAWLVAAQKIVRLLNGVSGVSPGVYPLFDNPYTSVPSWEATGALFAY
jgi:hypothetical protein